jgi:hypothetical protein
LAAGSIEGYALAMHQLEGKADNGNGGKANEQDGYEAAQQLGIGKMPADDGTEILPIRRRESESLTRRARPRHSVPL